jgi:hypothetical protein
MRPLDGEVVGNASTVPADTIVQDLIPLVAGSDAELHVVDGDQVVGVVDRRAVMSSLIEERV